MESPARALSSGLAEHVEAVCRHYLSNGRRCGNYWIVGDVNNNAGRSLYVRLKGPLSGAGARGRWTDAATSEHGDLLDLIRAREGLTSFRDTLDEARRFLRAPPAPCPVGRERRSIKRDTVALARKIWLASKPIAGTPAEACLRARKITADLHGAPLRYHPALLYRDPSSSPRRLPALVAGVTDNSGKIMGIHRTFLDPEAQCQGERRFVRGVRSAPFSAMACVSASSTTLRSSAKESRRCSRSRALFPTFQWSQRFPPRILRRGVHRRDCGGSSLLPIMTSQVSPLRANSRST